MGPAILPKADSGAGTADTSGNPKQPLDEEFRLTTNNTIPAALWGSAYIVVFVMVCTFSHTSHAQDTATMYDESQVKAAVEEAGVLNVCPDQTLLEISEIEVGDCRNHLAKLAPVCWHIIDPLISDYEIEKDEKTKEMAKDRFINIAVVYASCLRAELLREIVRTKRDNRTQ